MSSPASAGEKGRHKPTNWRILKSFLECSESFHRKEKMNNHVSFMLEADVAKRRLAQLFESEGLGKENRSTAIVACDASPAVRTGIERDSKPFEQKYRDRGLVRKRTRTALRTNQPGQVKRDLTVTGFVFTLVSVCAVLAAYTDRPVFWLLIGLGPLGIPHTIGRFLQQRLRRRVGLLDCYERDR
jgi:hypothetical protein